MKTVKISNKDGRDRADEAGAEAVEEVLSLSKNRGRGMEVDKREGTHRGQLCSPWGDLLDSCSREAGEDSQDEVAASTRKSRGPEGVASRGGQRRHQVEGGGFLDEDEMGFCLSDDGRQASEISLLVGVEREEGDDGCSL